MTDEEMSVDWIRSQGWSEENLPSDEFGQMLKAYLAGLEAGKPKWHKVADGDLPETSGEMHAERKPVLAYTKSLGWTQAVRRRIGKRKFEWVCSDYDGNTLFFDDEIIAWTELPEPQEGK